MFAVRILSGPQAGTVINLKEGENTLGRSHECDVPLKSQGISKKHLKINVQGSSITLTDLNSSNGTFVNGVRVVNHNLRMGDKISAYDVILDIRPSTIASMPVLQDQSQMTGSSDMGGNLAHQLNPQHTTHNSSIEMTKKNTQSYIDKVLVPSVTGLIRKYNYYDVLKLFVFGFIILVTVLSVAPMYMITKQGVEQESQRRALSLARALVQTNQVAIQQGYETSLSTQFANREEGVKEALIISGEDGHILAPATKSGKYADLPFVNKARRLTKEYVEQIDPSTVGASVPMQTYNAQTGGVEVGAYAVVLYDMAAVSVDSSQLISLLIQIIIIAGILGFFLYFFLEKVIELPFKEVNIQLDKSLQNSKLRVESDIKYSLLQHFILNINTAISRISDGSVSSQEFGSSSNDLEDRTSEAQSLIQIMPGPAIAIDKMDAIVGMNKAAESLSGVYFSQVQMQPVDSINDQALSLNLKDLIQRTKDNPSQITTSNLDLGGKNYEISSQAFTQKGSIEYIMITFKLVE